MDLSFIWLFVFLIFMMGLGMPVAIAMLASSFLYMQIFDINFYSAMVQSISAPMSQTLLATGFFILAGNLMNHGGITDRIFGFAKTLVGWIPGGLGHANVVASVIFAGMSGSATADAAGLGRIEIEAMTKNGYDTPFAAATTAASSVIGPIIPPSVPFVMYGQSAGVSPSVPMVMMAVITGVSTGRLFAAGMVPGVICALSQMIVVLIIALKRKYPRTPFPTLSGFWEDLKRSFLPLLTPVLMLVGIYTGAVTPSESAVLAGLYAIALGLLTHEIRIRDLPHIFADSCKFLISVLFIVVASDVFGYIITLERIPNIVTEMMMSSIGSSTGCLLVIVLIMLVVGCFMDGTAAIFIVAPILYPVAVSFGIDPIHFCLIFVFVLMAGVVTPPFGMVLFILQGITKIKFSLLVKNMVPFYIAFAAVILLFVFVPATSTWLPTLIYGS